MYHLIINSPTCIFKYIYPSMYIFKVLYPIILTLHVTLDPKPSVKGVDMILTQKRPKLCWKIHKQGLVWHNNKLQVVFAVSGNSGQKIIAKRLFGSVWNRPKWTRVQTNPTPIRSPNGLLSTHLVIVIRIGGPVGPHRNVQTGMDVPWHAFSASFVYF